jgi:hypothetical protein
MKRILNIFGMSSLAIVCLAACHDGGPYGLQIQEQQDKVTVSFSLSDARTVFPHVSLADVASYRLWGGVDGDAETELAEFTTRGTVLSLDPGVWNFTLDAYNESEGHLLRGTVENKQINSTGTNQVRFSLSTVNSGTGAIQITFGFPASAGITLIRTSGDINLENITHDGSGSFVYAKSEIPAGNHLINFWFYHGDVLRTVITELVLVRSNLSSSKTITLTGDDLKPVLTGTVSIIGTAEPGKTLTADTYYLGGTGTMSYQWKLNGVTVLGTESTYTVKAADVGGFITVTVTRADYDGDMSSAPTAVVSLL